MSLDRHRSNVGMYRKAITRIAEEAVRTAPHCRDEADKAAMWDLLIGALCRVNPPSSDYTRTASARISAGLAGSHAGLVAESVLRGKPEEPKR